MKTADLLFNIEQSVREGNLNRISPLLAEIKSKRQMLYLYQKYIGKDGLIAFEHGFGNKEIFMVNCWGVSDTKAYFSTKKNREKLLKDYSLKQLRLLFFKICRYAHYCLYIA